MPQTPPRRWSRFIPADAENTDAADAAKAMVAVHPRGCGEHPCMTAKKPVPAGSSPRGRGTHDEDGHVTPPPRFIPAWAGNTAPASPAMARFPVHPRVGGEHPCAGSIHLSEDGSSPRGRGTRWISARRLQHSRFIPAGAGNAVALSQQSLPVTVHPRGCGEHQVAHLWKTLTVGSSPRVRGTLRWTYGGGKAQRFIPAGAGNT